MNGRQCEVSLDTMGGLKDGDLKDICSKNDTNTEADVERLCKKKMSHVID